MRTNSDFRFSTYYLLGGCATRFSYATTTTTTTATATAPATTTTTTTTSTRIRGVCLLWREARALSSGSFQAFFFQVFWYRYSSYHMHACVSPFLLLNFSTVGSVGYPQIYAGGNYPLFYPSEDLCELCDRSATIPYTSVSSVTVAPQNPTLL